MAWSKPKILVQFDSDAHASVFDAIVAADAGVDRVLQYHSVEPTQVQDLVHGAMFTRGPQDLRRTAIFIGGSDVSVGEILLQQVVDCFFGPLRVSVLLDPRGANTTSAAAVLAAARHVELRGAHALVLAATGPVGRRVVRLLARQGAQVRVGSRSGERAAELCDAIEPQIPGALLTPRQTASPTEFSAALEGAQLVIAAGAAGVELLSVDIRRQHSNLQVAIDLNAVPPPGIAGVEVSDAAARRDEVICYGAIGIGGAKMKIHKAAIKKLFEANDQVLDAEQIYDLGRELEA